MTLRIHHLTDTHYPRPDNRLLDYLHALRRGALGPPPDLILHTGDLVDGENSPNLPPGLQWPLREQHQRLKEQIDTLGIPFYANCHTHDRKGDAEGAWGQTFLDVWRQPLMRVESLAENLDVIFVSGSVTLPPYAKAGIPPAWGFDVYDTHVLDELRTLVREQSRPGAFRLLCTHLPVLLPDEYFQQPARYPGPPIGGEGRGRILPMLEELDIRLVLGGHLHRAARHEEGRSTFIVGPSTLEPWGGIGELLVRNGEFSYELRSIPSVS